LVGRQAKAAPKLAPKLAPKRMVKANFRRRWTVQPIAALVARPIRRL
jgi:hypothetical protein